MGRFDVVGWMVHGNAANGIKIVSRGTFLRIYLHKSIKIRIFALIKQNLCYVRTSEL